MRISLDLRTAGPPPGHWEIGGKAIGGLLLLRSCCCGRTTADAQTPCKWPYGIRYFVMPSNPRKHAARAVLYYNLRECAEHAGENVLDGESSVAAALQPVRHNRCCVTRHAGPVVAAARSTRSTRFMLHMVVLHSHRGCARRSRLCTVPWRSAFARDGCSERIHISRRRW